MSTEPEFATPNDPPLALEKAVQKGGAKALLMIGWFSMGMAVAALGIMVGVELRSRYKFNHRTPYDFYANAGEQQASEFGVGV
jgi:hypothetical protein